MSNLARITINATASTPGGYDGMPSQALTFALEGGPANLVQRWGMQVAGPIEPDAPLASKSAPLITLVGATSGEKVNATTPGSNITCTLPGALGHSWIVRSIVNGGINSRGELDPDLVFERMVAIRTSGGLRKVIATEATQYGPGGWADAVNEAINANARAADFVDLNRQTTDATLTTALTIPIPDNCVVAFGVRVVARQQGGSANFSFQDFTAKISRVNAGIATLVNTVIADSENLVPGGWGGGVVDVDGGNNARVRIQGVAATTIKWNSQVWQKQELLP